MSDRLSDLFSGARARERWRRKGPDTPGEPIEASLSTESEEQPAVGALQKALTTHLTQLRGILESHGNAEKLSGPMVIINDLESILTEPTIDLERFNESLSVLDEVLAVLLTARRVSR